MDEAERKAAARATELLTEAGVESPTAEPDVMTEEEVAQEDVSFNEALSQVTPSSDETAAEETQPEAEQEALELPNLDPALPEDIADELEMDWEDDEPESSVEVNDDDEEYDDDDPQVQALKARVRKAEKKAAWAETKRMEAKKERWQEEAKKYFPLSEYALSDISATSRRGFLREARAAHDAIKPAVMTIVQKYADAHEALKQAAIAEGRQAATDAWGKPTVSPTGRSETTEQQRAEKIKKARNLEDRIKARVGW